jgi:hypothetical protein
MRGEAPAQGLFAPGADGRGRLFRLRLCPPSTDARLRGSAAAVRDGGAFAFGLL